MSHSALKELLREMTRDVISEGLTSTQTPPFSVLALKQLKTSKEIREYVRATLQRIGIGQARAAYAIDNDRVIKIALSDNKAYQNKNEVDNSKCLGQRLAVQVFSYHPRYAWIIEERITPMSSNQFAAKFNQLNPLDDQLKFEDSKDIQNFLTDASNLLTGQSQSRRYQERHGALMKQAGWYKELVEKLESCQVASWDFHKNNWGIRPSTGELVLLDVGFSRVAS